MKYVIIPKKIVTVNEKDEILSNYAIEVTDGAITNIFDKRFINKEHYETVYEYPNYILTPGFIQTHIHLCQTLFRGLADDLQLLDWLQQRIFPYENSHNKKSLKISAALGIYELQTTGTTTLMDMGTIRHQEIIFEELLHSKMRGFAGKCMMDINDLYPDFKESYSDCMEETYDLANEFHLKKSKKIRYGFAPRFVLSCSEAMLKDTTEMMKDFEGSLYHTHSSENKEEIRLVKKERGRENIEYFGEINVLGKNTVLAHCIHLNDNEIELLKKTKTGVVHCPSSNLKLASGIANIPKLQTHGIKVSIGADGAPCNNNLNIFTEMRLAALIQKPIHGAEAMNAKNIFKLATIDGAKTLNIEDETGSIEIGKKADFVLFDLNKTNVSLADEDTNIYSDIVYSADKTNIKEVVIEGQWVVEKGKSVIYDEEELVSKGKVELNTLLKRTKNFKGKL